VTLPTMMARRTNRAGTLWPARFACWTQSDGPSQRIRSVWFSARYSVFSIQNAPSQCLHLSPHHRAARHDPFLVFLVIPASTALLEITAGTLTYQGKIPRGKASLAKQFPNPTINFGTGRFGQIAGQRFPSVIELMIKAHQGIEADQFALPHPFIV